MLRPSTPPTRVEFSDSDDKEQQQQHVPKRKITDEQSAETNREKRRAFSDFISSSITDIDERLWDSYTQEALKLMIDFKRRSSAVPTVPGAPVVAVAGDDQ